MAIQKFADSSQLDTETGIVTDAKGIVSAPQADLPITLDSLKPANQLQYRAPDYPPVPGVNDINYTPTPIVATPEENDITKMIKGLTDAGGINEQIAGESAYRTSLEQANPDLEGQRKAEEDLSSQLKMLQAEAKNIPNQMQLSATGRGITAGGLAPLEIGALRENSIKANTVGALLAATQGKITYAQNLIDRAVKAKYDPLKAEQKAKLDNLDLLLKSPNLTIAETNRANAQKLIEERRLADIKKEETNHADIQKIALEAAKNKADAATLQKISNAKDPIEAAQLAQGFLDTQIAEEKALIEKGYTKLKPHQLAGLTEEDILRMPNGDIYKKPDTENSTVNAYVDQIKNGKLKITSVPAKIRDAVVKALNNSGYSGGGGGDKNVNEKQAITSMNAQLSTVVGADGFISPENYTIARNAWIKEGLSPTTFDTKFKGFRNPNNPNYITEKEKKSNSNDRTP